MAGLDPAIPAFARRSKNLGARDKPGHDEKRPTNKLQEDDP
jgi:hypothetical protein